MTLVDKQKALPNDRSPRVTRATGSDDPWEYRRLALGEPGPVKDNLVPDGERGERYVTFMHSILSDVRGTSAAEIVVLKRVDVRRATPRAR